MSFIQAPLLVWRFNFVRRCTGAAALVADLNCTVKGCTTGFGWRASTARRLFSTAVGSGKQAVALKHTAEGITIYEGSPYRNSTHLVWGNIIWDSGLALAKFFAWSEALPHSDVAEKVQAKSVLELGAGTGVVGLTLAKMGANVTATDYEPEVLHVLQLNAEANGLGDALEICELNWAQPRTYMRSRVFDIVVAADVLYNRGDRMFFRALAAHVSRAGGTVAYVASPPRADSPLDGFFNMILDHGLKLERLENPSGGPAGDTVGTAATVFGGSRFVTMCKERCTAAAKEHCNKVQIFRITHPGKG